MQSRKKYSRYLDQCQKSMHDSSKLYKVHLTSKQYMENFLSGIMFGLGCVAGSFRYVEPLKSIWFGLFGFIFIFSLFQMISEVNSQYQASRKYERQVSRNPK